VAVLTADTGASRISYQAECLVCQRRLRQTPDYSSIPPYRSGRRLLSFTTLFDANLHGGLAKWVRAITAAFGGGSTEKPRHRLSDVRGAAPNIAEELRHEALKATGN